MPKKEALLNRESVEQGSDHGESFVHWRKKDWIDPPDSLDNPHR